MQNVEHWPFGFPELKMRELKRGVYPPGVYPPFHCLTAERAAGEGWLALAFRFTRDM